MSWTILPIVPIVWALEIVSGYTLGNLLHVLSAVAPLVLTFRLLSHRRSIL